MKLCSQCKIEKPLVEFHVMAKSKDGRHPYCKECKARYASARHAANRSTELARQAAWREANREYTREVARKYYHEIADHETLRQRQRAKAQVTREFIQELKSVPCADCGECFPPVCMDFDHIGTDKKYNISGMKHLSVEAILEEVEKCEVVCSNCHRIRTQERREAARHR